MFDYLVRQAQNLASPVVVPLANGLGEVATTVIDVTSNGSPPAANVVVRSASEFVTALVRNVAVGANHAFAGVASAVVGTRDNAPDSDSLKDAKVREPMRGKRVFVVHGRDGEAWQEFKKFLKALGLTPYDYDDSLHSTAEASPYIGDVVKRGLDNAQAIVVLFTAEEIAELAPPLHSPEDVHHPINVKRWQARPNVIFEAGMALAKNPSRTILVALGADVQLFSDTAGRHIHRALRDDAAFRESLATKLKKAGCLVKRDKEGKYLTAGNLQAVIDQRSLS